MLTKNVRIQAKKKHGIRLCIPSWMRCQNGNSLSCSYLGIRALMRPNEQGLALYILVMLFPVLWYLKRKHYPKRKRKRR